MQNKMKNQASEFSDIALFKAGAAMRVVNPTKPTVPIGHGGETPYSEVFSDITVRALALEDSNGNQVIIIVGDFCQMAREVTDRIKGQIKEKYGIDEASVCVHATHSHSGPPLVERESPKYFDPEYTDFVIAQTVDAVGQAWKSKISAHINYYEDICTSLTINRRNTIDGKIYPAGKTILPNNRGIADFTVRVIEVCSVSDKHPIAILAEHAAHPVIVGPQALGGEFPGFMCKLVEKRSPGCIAFFLQGCCGNIRIRLLNDDATGWVKGSPEKAARMGYDLADAVDRALGKQPVEIAGPIASKYEVLNLKLERTSEPLTWPFRVQVLRFGDAKQPSLIIVALGGEPFIEYAFELRKRFAPSKTVVLGYSNALEGYAPTAAAYAEGGYEPDSWAEALWSLPGPYTPEIESILMNTVQRLAKS